MWDRIPKLNTYNNLSREGLLVLKDFSESYFKVLNQFS
jgi:hypothetical protein